MSRQLLEGGFPTGARLRSLRQALGLSQRELARRAGITNANLSMIEQDKVSPALFTLEKILEAMEFDLAGFFASAEVAQPVRRQAEFDVVRRKGGEFRVMPSRDGDVSHRYLARATVYSGGHIDGLWLKGRGAVSGVLIEGIVSLMLNGVAHVLHAGDGFEFLLERKHGFHNDTSDVATMILSIEVKL